MKSKMNSIRTFIGSKNYKESRTFYTQLGFEENKIGPKMSYFKVSEGLGFYLQDYYVKDWVNNSMVFLEVDNLVDYEKELSEKKLKEQFKKIRISKIKNEDWGRELFITDPSGILWHIGEFKKENI